MIRAPFVFCFGLLLAVYACGVDNPRPPVAVNCSVENDYDFSTPHLSDFTVGKDPDWFYFSDNTDTLDAGVTGGLDAGNKYPVAVFNVRPLSPSELCGNTGALEIQAKGHNFYGSGFGDWSHQATPTDGSAYEGLSFWARSGPNADKTFMFYVDDDHTYLNHIGSPAGGLLPLASSPGSGNSQDLDGDGFIGPGDIASGTDCRLPPIQALGYPACYGGGVLPPGTPTRVPTPDECGNQFHTYITITENWQLFLIPWNQLAQWPCPNREPGGIDKAKILQWEIKLLQGTNYDIWFAQFAFYRHRGDAGS